MNKYNSYCIKKINVLNNEEELVTEHEDKKINFADYRSMLKVYREIKEQYKDKPYNIQFMGMSDDYKFTTMFMKEAKIKEESNIQEVIEPKYIETAPVSNVGFSCSDNLMELVKIAENLNNAINERVEDVGNMLKVVDKSLDIIRHQILANVGKVSDEEKLAIYSKYEDILVERNKIKEEARLGVGFISGELCGKTKKPYQS